MAETYGALFCAGYAACYKNVRSFELSVAYVAAFNGDFFAVFADFEYAFVKFRALVVAHLSSAWNGVHDMVGVPRTESGDAAFGLASFVLEYGNAPAFDWTLEAFARRDRGDVGVLSFFEDFFGGYCFA